MAVMIPEKPRLFDPASLENLMFDALSLLPDDYYVFHSFRITNTNNNVFHESETDFIIYNRKKGILCLEAKAGQVQYKHGEWLYGSGIPMHNDGPFNQASSNKHKLRKYIDGSGLSLILNRCKFLHAVWFPSISQKKLESMDLPSEADKSIVMTKEALTDPKTYIDLIFSIKVFSKGKEIITNISEIESRRLIKEILCPEFNIFPPASLELDLKKIVFHRQLKEQEAILNYLDEQRTAAINGPAGTGKTMVAIEKARRHSNNNETVLFLCFNLQLKEFLDYNYHIDKVSYFTIAGFVCKICNSEIPDYNRAKDLLVDMYISGQFQYDHVIIDEGQDFGIDVIDEAEIIKILHDIIVDRLDEKGSFYVFYDKLQTIQSTEIPKFIDTLDCRLTLYRNCRNTVNIAMTSLKPVTERSPKLFEDAIIGLPAKLHYCESEFDIGIRIDKTIESMRNEGIDNIVVLTCTTEALSSIQNDIVDGKYKGKYSFTTCRKYKGLEADAVILVDVNKETFIDRGALVFYVGTSRARLRLDIFTTMSDVDCETVLLEALHYSAKIKRAKKDLASALNMVGSLVD